jgi:hypothetical protein
MTDDSRPTPSPISSSSGWSRSAPPVVIPTGAITRNDTIIAKERPVVPGKRPPTEADSRM